LAYDSVDAFGKTGIPWQRHRHLIGADGTQGSPWEPALYRPRIPHNYPLTLFIILGILKKASITDLLLWQPPGSSVSCRIGRSHTKPTGFGLSLD